MIMADETIPPEVTPATSVANWTDTMPELDKQQPAALETPTPGTPPQEPPPVTPPPEATKVPHAETEKDGKDADEEEKWPRDAKDWKKYKAKKAEQLNAAITELDTTKAEKTALIAEIEKLRGTIPTDELNALKKEKDDLTARVTEMDEVVKRTALAEHPRFKAYYEGLTKTQIEIAKGIVGADKAAEIERILGLPDGDYKDNQLEELSSDLPVVKQGRLVGILNRLSEIHAERAGELAKAREKVAQLTATEQQTAQQREQNKQQFVDKTLTAIAATDEFKPFMDSAAIDLAKRVVLGGTKDPADFVKMAARGLILTPKLLVALKAEQDKVAERDKIIASMKAATPGPGGGDETTKTEAVYTNPRTAIEDWMKGIPDVNR
jgi:hypothetical protein